MVISYLMKKSFSFSSFFNSKLCFQNSWFLFVFDNFCKMLCCVDNFYLQKSKNFFEIKVSDCQKSSSKWFSKKFIKTSSWTFSKTYSKSSSKTFLFLEPNKSRVCTSVVDLSWSFYSCDTKTCHIYDSKRGHYTIGMKTKNDRKNWYKCFVYIIFIYWLIIVFGV